MHQAEFSKKKGLFSRSYGLLLTVDLGTNTTLPEEFRHIKAAVLGWTAHRGKACEHVQLTVVLEQDEVPANKAYIEQIYHEEVELRPILQGLSFSVSFINGNEELIEEYTPSPSLP